MALTSFTRSGPPGSLRFLAEAIESSERISLTWYLESNRFHALVLIFHDAPFRQIECNMIDPGIRLDGLDSTRGRVLRSGSSTSASGPGPDRWRANHIDGISAKAA
jgi:hypothetical protein